MRTFLVFLLSLIFSSTAYAGRIGLSAVRHPEEDFKAAFHRHNIMTSIAAKPPQRVSKQLKDLNLTSIPNVGSVADLQNQFNYIRDLRFLEGGQPNFLRRLTWLYPDDGCYARAEMAAELLIENHFPVPKKIFVFGNLQARTANTYDGIVEWWYHVAVTYRVGNTAYVFDPALDPSKPLTLAEWNKGVGGTKTRVTYAICDHGTFDPNMDCIEPTPLSHSEAMREQQSFLPFEWNRLVDLKRNPEQELGEFPPWKK